MYLHKVLRHSPIQVGISALHTPPSSQVKTDSPSRSYPSSQEKMTMAPTLMEVFITPPLSGAARSSHSMTACKIRMESEQFLGCGSQLSNKFRKYFKLLKKDSVTNSRCGCFCIKKLRISSEWTPSVKHDLYSFTNLLVFRFTLEHFHQSDTQFNPPKYPESSSGLVWSPFSFRFPKNNLLSTTQCIWSILENIPSGIYIFFV